MADHEAGHGHDLDTALERYRMGLHLARIALSNFLATHADPEDMVRLHEATAVADRLETSVVDYQRGIADYEDLEPMWADVYDAVVALEPGEGLTGEVHPHVTLLDRILDETAGASAEDESDTAEMDIGQPAEAGGGRWVALERKGDFDIGDIMLLHGEEVALAHSLGAAKCSGQTIKVEFVRTEDIADRLQHLLEEKASADAVAKAAEDAKRQGAKERLAARMAATAKRRAAGM